MSLAEKEEKILFPNSVPTRPRLENSQKTSKEIQEIKKNIMPVVFLSKLGWDRLRKGEKKI